MTSKPPVAKKSSLRLKLSLVAAGIAVLAGAVYGVKYRAAQAKLAPPKEFSVKALQAKATGDPGKVFQEVHQAMERTDLTDEQKHAIRENAHEVMEAEMDKRIDAYFAATTPVAKNAVLDRDIDEMQAHMKEWQQRRAERERQMGGTSSRPGDVRGDRPGGSDAGGPAGNAGPAANGRGPGGPGDRHGPPTRTERQTRSESRDPDKSARRIAYMSAMRQRAQDRGIQMFRGPGGPGGPGGGR